MLKRSLYSLRHHWKKILAHILTYSILFSLCFGAIMVYSTVRGQQEFLQSALQRAVTLRGESYTIRVSRTSAGGIDIYTPYEKFAPILQDEAVEDWNTCRFFPMHIEGCEVLYAQERAESYEEHRYGQIFYVHEDGMIALCVRDSARSQAFVTTGFQLIEGEHFSGDDPGDVIMVSEDFAKLNGLHIGDKIKASNVLHDDLYPPFTGELEITGIFRAPDSTLIKGIGARPEEMIVVPFAVYSRFLQKPAELSEYPFVTFYLKEGADQQAFLDRLYASFPITRTLDDFYNTYSQKPPEETVGMNFDEIDAYVQEHPEHQIQLESQWYDMVAKPLDQEAKLAGAMMYLLLGSVVLIISLMVALSIKERRREVGILLSMGESKIKLIGQLAVEMALPIFLALGIGVGVGSVVGVPLAEGLCNGVYEQTAEDTQSENESITFSALENQYSDSWSMSERFLVHSLIRALHFDMEVFPQAEVQTAPQTTAAYAALILAAALLALLAQSAAILTAKPAKILLNRR